MLNLMQKKNRENPIIKQIHFEYMLKKKQLHVIDINYSSPWVFQGALTDD